MRYILYPVLVIVAYFLLVVDPFEGMTKGEGLICHFLFCIMLQLNQVLCSLERPRKENIT